ncbi:MAG: hypothetical protein A2284_17630 [Deltaproteobacteria bacterium RIFOXYA12_FULL_61_11]|nr:MAG: hypothetical protein A2284_17630 [Deltaproteobacteria bacterium RIFOXYA12_FULL_61_11]
MHRLALLIVLLSFVACDNYTFAPDKDRKTEDTNPQETTAAGVQGDQDPDALLIEEPEYRELDPTVTALLADDSITDCICPPGPVCDCRNAEDRQVPNICSEIKGNRVCTRITSARLGNTGVDGALDTGSDGQAGTSGGVDGATNPGTDPDGTTPDGDDPTNPVDGDPTTNGENPTGTNPDGTVPGADGITPDGATPNGTDPDGSTSGVTDGPKAGTPPPAELVEYLFDVRAEIPTIVEEHLLTPTTSYLNHADDSPLFTMDLALDCEIALGTATAELPGEVVQLEARTEFHDADGNVTYTSSKIITLGTSRRVNLEYEKEEFDDELEE